MASTVTVPTAIYGRLLEALKHTLAFTDAALAADYPENGCTCSMCTLVRFGSALCADQEFSTWVERTLNNPGASPCPTP